MDNNNQNNNEDQYTNYTYTPDNNNNTYTNPSSNPYTTPDQSNNIYNNGYNYNYESEPTEEQAKGKSIGSMITGICSIITCSCFGIPGIILGIIALVLSNGYKSANNGKKNGFATAGFVTGLIGLILSALFFVYVIICFIIGASIAFYDL